MAVFSALFSVGLLMTLPKLARQGLYGLGQTHAFLYAAMFCTVKLNVTLAYGLRGLSPYGAMGNNTGEDGSVTSVK